MHLTKLRLALCATAALSTAACGLGALPTTPSGPSELEIRGTTLLMVGGRGRLSAWQARDNGDLREVRATWRAEGDAISLTADGGVTGRRLGHAVVHASSGERTGTTTVHVVTRVDGRWHGSITVVDCWESPATTLNPCEGRHGLTAPLVLDITQRTSADLFDNLRATVRIFTPPAIGSFIGALDSSGHLFLEGYVERTQDPLDAVVRFRWQLDGDRLLPFSIDGEIVNVQLSRRMGTASTLFNEIWRVSTMTR